MGEGNGHIEQQGLERGSVCKKYGISDREGLDSRDT